MTFYPDVKLEHEVELFVNSDWTDVSGDVLRSPGISIKRGRGDQSTTPSTGSCDFVLRNDNGDYSPNWPTGAYYGSIGKNTPLRVATIVSKDAFGRSVSSGWGSDDYARAWTSGGSGGSVQASDHGVGSGVGTQSVPATNAYRYDYLSTCTQKVVDVRADVSLSFTNVTGASVYPCGIMLRGQDTSTYYHVRVEITTAEAVTIGVFLADGTTVAAAVTVSGLTHSSSQTLRVRAQAEGHTIRGKVWASTADEPFGWHITTHAETINTAGFVGIRSGVQTSNTNTLPIVFSIDNVRVRVPMFAGEISDMPAGWDVSGNFVTAEVRATGVLARLSKGKALQSAFRRGYLRDLTTAPLIYWPCEEKVSSTYFAPAIGIYPMWITNGAPTLANSTDFECSDALPTLNFSAWWAQIPPYTPGSNTCQVRFLVSIPTGGLGLGQRRMCLITFAGGSVGNISCFVDQSGNVAINVYDTNLTAIHIGASVAGNLNGIPHQIAIEFQQNTATLVKINVITLGEGDSAIVELGTTNVAGSQTLGIATSITVDPDVLMTDSVAMGHYSFHTTNQSILALSSQLNAWRSETAGARLSRLTTEERLPFSYIGTLSDSEPMGPQLVIELQKLMYECQHADMGELFESRGEPGVTYRPRSNLHNQTAAITLDYSLGQINEPFRSTDDDQYLKNDITVTRPNGGNWRATLETGRLSTLPPELGGSGRYDDTRTVNVYDDTQLPDIAGWLLSQGTVAESRYPTIVLDLGNLHLTSAGFQDAVLDLDVGDRIVITNPKSGQQVGSISQLIVGMSVIMNQWQFVVTFNCIPESPFQVGVLSDTDKRLDSDYTTLTSDITSSATSFTVTIATGRALWTTAAGDLPISVTIGGEQMSIGAVSGASSPQTFSSVTRSVNGVVKAQNAGAEVHVTYPFRLA